MAYGYRRQPASSANTLSMSAATRRIHVPHIRQVEAAALFRIPPGQQKTATIRLCPLWPWAMWIRRSSAALLCIFGVLGGFGG
jgi:hypothetical protein